MAMAALKRMVTWRQAPYMYRLAARPLIKYQRTYVYEANLDSADEKTITTFYTISLNKPTRVQTDEYIDHSSTAYNFMLPSKFKTFESGEYKKVSRNPPVFLYHYDENAIVTASSIRSKLSVMEIFPDLCEKIPYVPVDQILAPLPPDSDMVPLSMEFNLVSVDTFKKFPGIPPNFDMEMLKSFYLTVMDAVDRVTPPQGVDGVTVNRSLVYQLRQMDMFRPSNFVVDYQGTKTDESRQVTNVSAKPDIVLYRRDFIHEDQVTAAIVACPDLVDDEEDAGTIIGGVGELKGKRKKWDIYQLLANMVKVSGDLAIKSICEQENLFKYIKMYGLLIEYKTYKAEVLELNMDFMRRKSFVMRSQQELAADECFQRLAKLL